jgi:hypothetical protein
MSRLDNNARRVPRLPAVALVALALILLASVPAGASIINLDVQFSANTFQASGGTPPVDPVNGEFTISFDPTLTYSNDAADITLKNLNINLGSAICFSYETVVDGSFAAGTLRVGGSFDGSDTVQYSPATDDFWLFIPGIATTPTFSQVGYAQVDAGNNLFYTINQTGSVTVTPIPEPVTLTLLALGGALTVMRRRRPQ